VNAILALDTSTALGGVALAVNGHLAAAVQLAVQARQAESLLPAVDFVLRQAGMDARRLDGVVVAGGPGSFTGVRIAAATAKGLVHALGLPLLAYSGLLAEAASACVTEAPVCALFDARRGEVYAACYRFPGLAQVETLLEPMIAPVNDVLAAMADGPAAGVAAITCVGDGARRYRRPIGDAGGIVAPAHVGTTRAAALLWLAETMPAEGRVVDAGAWVPQYLRESGAERGVQG
jgi:tRNA threonylcarbamoyladenosine biosynthesis protein TsaB